MAAQDLSPEDYVQIERESPMPARRRRATFILSGELDTENMDRLVRAVLPDAVGRVLALGGADRFGGW